MSANVEVSERVYFLLCCSLKNTVYAAVISSSTDTLAVHPETEKRHGGYAKTTCRRHKCLSKR